MDDILDKFEPFVFKNLDEVNFKNIIIFLENKNCDFVKDIISDYLDVFTIDYKVFVEKYNLLNKKYDYNFLEKASNDMNLLEELMV